MMGSSRDFVREIETGIQDALEGQDRLAVQLLRLEAIYAFLAEWRCRRFGSAQEMQRWGEDAVPFIGFNPCSPCRGPFLPYLPCFWQANLAARLALALTGGLSVADAARLRMSHLRPLQQLSESLYQFKMAQARARRVDSERAWQRVVAVLATSGFRERSIHQGEPYLGHALQCAQKLATRGLGTLQEIRRTASLDLSGRG